MAIWNKYCDTDGKPVGNSENKHDPNQSEEPTYSTTMLNYTARKILSLTSDWRTYLKEAQVNSGIEFEQHERTGRSLGKEKFIEKAECLLR